MTRLRERVGALLCRLGRHRERRELVREIGSVRQYHITCRRPNCGHAHFFRDFYTDWGF